MGRLPRDDGRNPCAGHDAGRVVVRNPVQTAVPVRAARLCTLRTLFGQDFVHGPSRHGRLCTLATAFERDFVHWLLAPVYKPLLRKVPPSPPGTARHCRFPSVSHAIRGPTHCAMRRKGRSPPSHSSSFDLRYAEYATAAAPVTAAAEARPPRPESGSAVLASGVLDVLSFVLVASAAGVA